MPEKRSREELLVALVKILKDRSDVELVVHDLLDDEARRTPEEPWAAIYRKYAGPVSS